MGEGTMILTDGQGRPFVKPDPQDFATTTEFLCAYWAYKDAIADCANKAFDSGLRASLRRSR
jgi:hypothetical protein